MNKFNMDYLSNNMNGENILATCINELLYTWDAVSPFTKALFRVVEDWRQAANVNSNGLKPPNRNKCNHINASYNINNVENSVLHFQILPILMIAIKDQPSRVELPLFLEKVDKKPNWKFLR